MSNEVLFETAGAIATITINRPAQRNAINAAVRQGMFEAWARFEEDKALRVAILTGAGDQAFCAGADLKEMAENRTGPMPHGWLPVIGDSVRVTKPVIAAVNGVAYAGGWKKFEPLWGVVIRAKRAGAMLPVLERVLAGAGWGERPAARSEPTGPGGAA